MELSLQTRTVADNTVLEVGGEIDVYTAPRLRERLLELIAEGERRLLVDLAGVEFLDSTGLGVLVGVQRLLGAQGGHLGLVCRQERILKVFRITGLDRFFDMHFSVEEAAAAISDDDMASPDGEEPGSRAGPTAEDAPEAPGS
ncbi:MAG: anti-sigma factor antagonist [Micromonosporaceae bacterium]|nr:anti-sigma factor antagonist [Micromonosporaceae bacterium]